MKALLVFALILWQASSASQRGAEFLRNFRYRRTITLPQSGGPSCAILDAAIFPHAGLSLKDLRLVQGGREVPYAITLSEPAQADADPAVIRNLGLRRGAIVFDLEMPRRPYTEIVLDLASKDFLATASVDGTRNPDYTGQTHLGDFTVFDLSSQHLSRSTTLPLQETDLPYLHVELTVSNLSKASAPDPQTLLTMVRGVSVPPSRDAQSVYSNAVTSRVITQRGRQSVAGFVLPERIPIERISFDLDPAYKGNFSRTIRIRDRPASPAAQPNEGFQSPKAGLPAPDRAALGEAPSETLAGTILRVHLSRAGRVISREQLSVPATLGSNMQSPATVQVAIDNGDDPPLPVTAVRLEMRQRKLCFEAQGGLPPLSNAKPQGGPQTPSLALLYGDAKLSAPAYDYGRLSNPKTVFSTARLGPEQLNAAYRGTPDARPFAQRHPHLLWMVLLLVLCVVFVVAARSTRTARAR